MLFVRLLVVGSENVPKQEIIQLLHQHDDIENQTTQNRNSGEFKSSSLRIADKKVKIEVLSHSQVIENITKANSRYWSKLHGIIFLQAPKESLYHVEYITQKILDLKYVSKYNYTIALLEDGTSEAKELSETFSFCYHSFEYVKNTTGSKENIYKSFASMVMEINHKHKGTPQRTRRRSSRVPLKFDNEVSQPSTLSDAVEVKNTRAEVASDAFQTQIFRSNLPSATSEQVAQLTEPTPTNKKKRRKSFLSNLKSSGKKKKRRESLLESGDSDGSDVSDSDDSGYSSGSANCIEDMEGFFPLDQILDYMIYSSNVSRESMIESFVICLSSIIPTIVFARQLIVRWDTQLKDPKALPILRNRIIGIIRTWFDISQEIHFSKECVTLLEKFFIASVFPSAELQGVKELHLEWEQKKTEHKPIQPRDETQLLSPRPPRSAETIEPSISLSVAKIYSPLEVASQLTLIEHKRFQRIKVNEFLDSNWTRAEKDILSPNLLHMIHHSTFVTLWIQTIILSESDLKERSKTIKWCINVAQKCRELANFNSLMAIIGALQSCPIDRLKRTWEEVGVKNRKKVDQLFNLMVRENYKEYRAIIKTCSGPCVPFPGMWLSDLQFIECGNVWVKKSNEESLSMGQINLTKVAMVSKIIKDCQRFQKTSYALQENQELQNLLRSPATVDDEVAYTISIELEPIITEAERAEFKRALGDACDPARLQKFENKAYEVSRHPQEIIDAIERWNRKLRDDYTMKEAFCLSDALEILLIKLCSMDIKSLPPNLQRELYLRLQQLFSHCLVGDSNKHQQLMECLRRLQAVNTPDCDLLSRRLIRCFKIPPKYRELSHDLAETEDEIMKLREQIEVLEQQLCVADKDYKEHQVQRRRLENQMKIVQLQQRKSDLIEQKDAKKHKILVEFTAIATDIQEKLSGATNQATSVEWTNELMNLSKNMKGTEREYIEQKQQFVSERDEIVQQKEKLEVERKRLLEQLQAVEKRLGRLDQKQNSLEARWSAYQSDFSSSKKNLVEKTDDLMNLLDDADQKNKAASYLHGCMEEFHSFFASVLNLQRESGNESQITKQLKEQQGITTRDTKRYLQSLLKYFKYFEHAMFTLKQEWTRNDETISGIITLQLCSEVLHREFPQYFDLLDKSKTIKKDFARVKKEFVNVEKQQPWEDIFSHSGLDEATRCLNSLAQVRKSIAELERCITEASY